MRRCGSSLVLAGAWGESSPRQRWPPVTEWSRPVATRTPSADQATIDLLADYFAAMEAKDLDRLAGFYTDDITLTLANAPTITGRDAMINQMATLLGKVTTLAHPLINVWQEDGGVVIFEVASIWIFPGGAEITINACSIFTVTGGKFSDQRIYVDNAPVDPYLA